MIYTSDSLPPDSSRPDSSIPDSSIPDFGSPRDTRFISIFKRFGMGVCIGIANIIPGVSGGTIAVIFGIYHRIIQSINAIVTCPSRGLRGLIFLSPIILGALAGVFGSSFVMTPLLHHYESYTYAAFIGLVLGTVPFIFTRHTDMAPRFFRLISLVVMAGLVAGLAFLPVPEPNLETGFRFTFGSAMYLGVSGFVAAATMVLPGISGSLILLILGTYHRILFAIQQLDILMLVIICAGALLGLLSATRLISWLFRRFPAETYYGIIGLLIGSVIKLWPHVMADVAGNAVSGSFILTGLCGIAGAGLSFVVSRGR